MKEKEKRRAILKVSWELLRQLLNLPEDTELIGSLECQQWHAVRLLIEHPALHPVKEGEYYPPVNPTFHRQAEVVFEGWGQS